MDELCSPKTVQRTPFKRWCDENTGLFFLIPWILGFLIFKAYPFASSLVYSFTDLNFFKGISQYGLMNYVEIFTSRKTVSVLLTTVKYAFITVPLKLVFALFIAYILNFKIKFVNLFRTVYYIPSILGGSVTIAVLWRALFRIPASSARSSASSALPVPTGWRTRPGRCSSSACCVCGSSVLPWFCSWLP